MSLWVLQSGFIQTLKRFIRFWKHLSLWINHRELSHFIAVGFRTGMKCISPLIALDWTCWDFSNGIKASTLQVEEKFYVHSWKRPLLHLSARELLFWEFQRINFCLEGRATQRRERMEPLRFLLETRLLVFHSNLSIFILFKTNQISSGILHFTLIK